jgi:predicted NBD/HSP70 family sugar kinase
MVVGVEHKARVLRLQGALALLRHVHLHPGATRAELTRALGLSSGSAAEISARLKATSLVEERPAPPTGGRGRPSPALGPHLDGPLVCAVDLRHEDWHLAVAELGGAVVDTRGGRYRLRVPDRVIAAIGQEVAAAARRHGDRVQAVSVSVAGTIQDGRVMQMSTLGWQDVGLDPLRLGPDVPLLVGNDASLGGLAEARRGAGAGVGSVLHLTVEVGVGGVLVVGGQLMTGATGAGGEFGHMPFGDPSRACPCGASGCWDLEVDGRAMARLLGRPPPADPRTLADQVVTAAGAGDAAARAAVGTAAGAFGRGVAALVNALDPDVVTLSGLARSLVAVAPAELEAAYQAGLMRFRRADPPPLLASTIGAGSALVGAAEVGFDAVLTEAGLDRWARRGEGRGDGGDRQA